MPLDKPIRPDFSAAFQLRYCLAMVAGSVLTSLALYLYLDRGLGESYFQSLVTLSHLDQALPAALILTFVVQLVLILLLTIAINLFVSHKIAGPVYRYELFLHGIRAGELRHEVRTREGDQLKSMVTCLNRLTGALRQLYLSLRAVEGEATAVLERSQEETTTDLERLREKVRAARSLLGDSFSSGEVKAP